MAQRANSIPFAELSALAILAAASVVSGLALVAAKHESRQLFAELEALNREQDRLQVDWGRWQLEQSAYATHSLIEAIARDRLQMRSPGAEQRLITTELGK